MQQEQQKYRIIELEKFYKAYQPNLTTTKDGIVFWNSRDNEEDNAFPQKLQDSYKKSAVHANFVNLTANLIYASGLYPVNETDQQLIEFLRKPNRQGITVDDVFQRASFDTSMYEAAAFQVVYDSTGKIAEVYHTNPSYIRAEEPDELGIVNNWYYSTTWGDITNKKNKKGKANDINNATIIASFNPERGVKDGRQLLYVPRYSATNDIYPLPQYTSALNFIELEHLLSEYIVNKIANGFYPTGILYIPSNLSPEERDAFVKDFRTKHEGPGNSSKIVFTFGDNAAQKPAFEKLSDDLGNALVKDLISMSQRMISTAHGGSLALIGIDESQNFGTNANASNINTSRLFFIDSVIRHYQINLLKAINKILAVNELGEVTVNNDSLKLQQPPVAVGDGVLTRDEVREIVYGLPPMVTGTTETNNIASPSTVQ